MGANEQSWVSRRRDNRSVRTKTKRQIGSRGWGSRGWHRSRSAGDWGCLSAHPPLPRQRTSKLLKWPINCLRNCDRVRGLEAAVRYHQDRGDRAEKWLYRISLEIEQQFFGREEGRHPQQPPPPQALFRVSGNKRRQEPLRRPDLSTFFSRYSLIKRPSQQTIRY